MEALPLTGRPGLLQGGWASHRESEPLTGRLDPHREARPLTERLGGRPGFLKGGRVSLREAGPLTGRPGLLKRGRASQRIMHNLLKKLIKLCIFIK